MLIRSLGGGFFLLPYVFKEKIFPIKNLIAAGIFMAVFLLALAITTRISSSAMAISMQYTAPMYVIGYGFYKNKKIIFNKFLVFLLIFVGILFSIMNNIVSYNWLAVCTGIITGSAFVFYSYNLQKIKHGNLLGIISLINIISSIFYIIVLLFNYNPPPTSFTEVGVLVVSGIIISGFSYVIYGNGLRTVSIEKALIICLIEPVLNPLWVFLGNGEIPSLMTLIGVLLIILGAILDIINKN